MVYNDRVLTQKVLLSWKGMGTRRDLEMTWRELAAHPSYKNHSKAQCFPRFDYMYKRMSNTWADQPGTGREVIK